MMIAMKNKKCFKVRLLLTHSAVHFLNLFLFPIKWLYIFYWLILKRFHVTYQLSAHGCRYRFQLHLVGSRFVTWVVTPWRAPLASSTPKTLWQVYCYKAMWSTFKNLQNFVKSFVPALSKDAGNVEINYRTMGTKPCTGHLKSSRDLKLHLTLTISPTVSCSKKWNTGSWKQFLKSFMTHKVTPARHSKCLIFAVVEGWIYSRCSLCHG